MLNCVSRITCWSGVPPRVRSICGHRLSVVLQRRIRELTPTHVVAKHISNAKSKELRNQTQFLQMQLTSARGGLQSVRCTTMPLLSCLTTRALFKSDRACTQPSSCPCGQLCAGRFHCLVAPADCSKLAGRFNATAGCCADPADPTDSCQDPT